LSVLNPKCFPCVLVFEIWITFICRQPEIQIKLHWPSPSAYSIDLPSPAYNYYSTSAKDLKRNSAQFKPGQDSNNQQKEKILTPTRGMAPLTCELWQAWCSLTFSDVWSQHCEGSLKNSCYSFSVWPPGTGEKLPAKSWTLIT
jgi:hypothetical protein